MFLDDRAPHTIGPGCRTLRALMREAEVRSEIGQGTPRDRHSRRYMGRGVEYHGGGHHVSGGGGYAGFVLGASWGISGISRMRADVQALRGNGTTAALCISRECGRAGDRG
jgi:hypothetical protein